ncbi:hypothetical protein SAMN05428985_111105 [Nocardioides sp. YR527]|uniref:hypothetical protein n=1 Tax=Nocardioides sp. YR527 TaxID=1881028 RepID=UPI00089005EE|nr:hypothetical protein [Nocardioides sp. YR527]SDL22445.1 hypothetical protein SAMN05428985_111105 [Nocardioides sp. YR527]
MIKRFLAAAALAMAVTSISSGAIAAEGGSVDKAAKGAGTTEGVVAAAVSPSVSPAAEKVIYKSRGLVDYSCPSERLCVDVWDPTRGTYKIFQFWQCQTHALTAFLESPGYPEIVNNQTQGTVTRFLNSSRAELKDERSVAKHGRRPIGWDPIYYIDVC